MVEILLLWPSSSYQHDAFERNVELGRDAYNPLSGIHATYSSTKVILSSGAALLDFLHGGHSKQVPVCFYRSLGRWVPKTALLLFTFPILEGYGWGNLYCTGPAHTSTGLAPVLFLPQDRTPWPSQDPEETQELGITQVKVLFEVVSSFKVIFHLFFLHSPTQTHCLPHSLSHS